MTAKEVIKNVCIYLGKDDILNSNLFIENGEELSTQNQKELDLMVDCLNFVTEEISSENLPIYKSKKINLENGKIKVNLIDEKIQDIVSVKGNSEKSLKYRIIDENLVCLANSVEVIYTVYPNKVNIDSNIELFNGCLSARVLAYGVASEFCYMQMLYSDASIWENRFKNSLLTDVRKKGNLYLKTRRFI